MVLRVVGAQTSRPRRTGDEEVDDVGTSPCSSATSNRCDVILRCRLVCSASRNNAAACGYGGPPPLQLDEATVVEYRLLGKLLEDALEPRQMLGRASHHHTEAEHPRTSSHSSNVTGWSSHVGWGCSEPRQSRTVALR